MQSLYDKGCDELKDESLATDMCAMQSTYDKGCDELTDDSEATDICAYCAADDKLQPALYFCFHCGPFGRYMCGDCNKQHNKFAFQHDALSISTATPQTSKILKCNKATDKSGAIDICARCASKNKIERAFFFCFNCGPLGRYLCWFCKEEWKKHYVKSVAEALTSSETRFYIVAAIDIGTTNSGYAFSTNESFCRDPSKVYSHHWGIRISTESRLVGISTKAPTCVLFDKNKKFHSFGFEAEDNYRELALVDEHKDYYFFRRFRRTLFDKMQPKQKMMLEDEMGKSMDAKDVFSACIKFLLEDLKDELRKRISDNIRDDDIRWVITLPGFCNEASKEFMWESAQKAGIHKERLLIATEPEAAITFARNIPVKISTESDRRLKPFTAKSDNLGVLDAGGYTTKITVHEVKDSRTVRELYKTSDVKLGSTNIDKAFRDFLATIVGNDIMDDFQQNNLLDYNEMFKEFDIKKRNIENDMKEKINLKFPVSLCKTFENAKGIRISDHLKTKPEYNDKVCWVYDKLRIDSNIIKGLFQETFDKIASHMKSLFSKPEVKDVQNILMVGEFSESPLLQDFIKKTFPNKRIIIPEDPRMSVLQGAVILGHIW